MQVKPYKTYQQQVDLLKEKGMIIPDEAYAIKKLTQINYYRLSGFWHTCKKSSDSYKKELYNAKYDKKVKKRIEKRLEEFEECTNFNLIIDLYEFDKKLRLLMLDAIDTIEIFMRAIMAYSLGYDNVKKKDTPLAYKDNNLIDINKFEKQWIDFKAKCQQQIDKSKEDFIHSHKDSGKDIPFWVVVEIWDFGTISHFYVMLKTNHKNRICKQLDIINPNILTSWLRELNKLRNRCAHHARIWNHYNTGVLSNFDNLFDVKKLNYTENAAQRLYGFICVIHFLLCKICPEKSTFWIKKVIDLINAKPNLPNCNFYSMGINTDNGLDISAFEFKS